MAGYKQTIKDLSPKMFLTFDQDTDYSNLTGYLTADQVYDESANDNNAYVSTDYDTNGVKSYAMGITSLVQTEVSAQQAAFVFAPLEFNDSADFPLERTVLEVLSSTTCEVPNDFTIMFLINKNHTSRTLMDTKKWNYTTSTYGGVKSGGYTYKRTIFCKGLDIAMKINMPWSQPENLEFTFPDYTTTINLANLPTTFYNKTHHITMSHKVIQLGFGVYQSKYTVYYDGVIIITNLGPEVNTASTALNPTSWIIGGNLASSDPDHLDDRTTSPTKIDQFTVFDYALTDNQVIDCFKKCGNYYQLIKSAGPGLYIPFSDQTSTPGNALFVDNGLPGLARPFYSDTEPFTIRQTPTTTKIGADLGVTFVNGMAYILSSASSAPSRIINATADFTLEFWCKFQNSTKSVIFSCQSIVYPFAGLLVEANVRNNEESWGSIQVSLDQNTYVCSPQYDASGTPINFADNEYRHYAICRRGTVLELWVDGVLLSTKPVFSTTLVPDTGQLYIMGMSPGQLMTNGSLCHMVFYPTRALKAHELQARAYFTVLMMLKGKITVQGVPYPGTVRIFDHNSGALLHEYKAGEDGIYSFNVYTNNYIDAMFFSSTDMNVRYQTVGPILATQYADVEWW